MGPLIAQVADILAQVPGIQAVRQSSRAALGDTPAALLEAVCENEQWERELGASSLTLEARLSFAIVEPLPNDPAQVPATRDRVMALARACRAALAVDPSLNGACRTSRIKRTDFSYATLDGVVCAQALTILEAVQEQAL